MEDRELLELAAKSCGFELRFRALTNMPGAEERPRIVHENGVTEKWNPLEDDGDAFRLAAYLRLEVIPGKHAGDGCSVNSRRHEIPGVTVFRDSKDMAEQMRRAIVMAAAEIGKSMP